MTKNEAPRRIKLKSLMPEDIGKCDLLLMTLDTLRYDVAVAALKEKQTPFLAAQLPEGGWELRHSPGSFTYAAHQAFFAGFLPTPARPGPHQRLFAVKFPGSETIGDHTTVFDASDIVTGLAGRGYHTICIGGVGFFNKCSPLGHVLPGLFAESHWSAELGVTERNSMSNQVQLAVERLSALPIDRRVFLFINVSALHQPNCFYVPGETVDSPRTQQAALAYVDSCLPALWSALRQRGRTFCIVTSDHGTAYGEDGYTGHRLAHPVVWNVPYGQFWL